MLAAEQIESQTCQVVHTHERCSSSKATFSLGTHTQLGDHMVVESSGEYLNKMVLLIMSLFQFIKYFSPKLFIRYDY